MRILIFCLAFVAFGASNIAFAQSTGTLKELLEQTPLSSGSGNFLILMNEVVVKGTTKLTVVQSNDGHLAMMVIAWTGAPLVYAKDGDVLFPSGNHPGKIELGSNTRFDFSATISDDRKYSVGFALAPISSGVQPFIKVDAGKILQVIQLANVPMRFDPSNRICTAETPHSFVTVQRIPQTADNPETDFISVASANAHTWLTVIRGKTPWLALPMISPGEVAAAPTLIEGNNQSVADAIGKFETTEIWKDEQFLQACKTLRDKLHPRSWFLEALGVQQLEALASARSIAIDVASDEATRGKVNEMFEKRIQAVRGQIPDCDLDAPQIRNRFDRIFELGHFTEDLSKLLPSQPFYEFTKRYLAHPTAMTILIGSRRHASEVLSDAEAIKVPAEKLAILSRASIENCLNTDQITHEYLRFDLNQTQYNEKGAVLSKEYGAVFRSALSDADAAELCDRALKRPTREAITGLEVGK